MSVKKFIDTNIVFYSCDVSDPRKHGIALQVIADLSKEQTGVVSTQVLGEFFHATVVRKKLLTAAEAEKVIGDYSNSFAVAGIDAELVRAAIKFHTRFQTSYWDSLILATAARHLCVELLSEDLNAGQTYDGVRVVNPFAEISKA
jgi:predicted nucleic acid-binding protein